MLNRFKCSRIINFHFWWWWLFISRYIFSFSELLNLYCCLYWRFVICIQFSKFCSMWLRRNSKEQWWCYLNWSANISTWWRKWNKLHNFRWYKFLFIWSELPINYRFAYIWCIIQQLFNLYRTRYWIGVIFESIQFNYLIITTSGCDLVLLCNNNQFIKWINNNNIDRNMWFWNFN